MSVCQVPQPADLDLPRDTTDSPRSQIARRLAMCFAMLMTIVYLTLRALFTLNLASPWSIAFSLTLYLAECYGGFLLFLFFFQIWDVRDPAPLPALPGRTVDVLIPTYNEDPQLLRGTISAALKIDYPHRTYVLDDGKRAEVKALCEELGADYITRPNNLHAKAGNLNHALAMTDGEFVVIFDADHVADRHFIDRLVGYFADADMGFVQTPHAFYNFDAFQGVLNYARGKYWEEGMLFYNVTQPGKNRWNSVSFCGSAAMFRRRALEDVGLVATESITEDMLTGLRMHAKGWKSLFVNERLIAAIAAEDITSFTTQRLRWGEGNLGIFAIENPLTMKGLTWPQRICYLGSMLSWTTGVQKLLIYSTPMLMLLTGVAPVNKLTWQFALLVSLYLGSVWTGVKVASNGYGWLLAIEMTQMISFWTQVRSTWRAVFGRRKARFVVTSKRGPQSNNILRFVTPQIVIIAGSALAILWALVRYFLRISDDVVGLAIGSGLLIIYSYMAWIVIGRALRSGERRSSWRHPVALHVDFEMVTDEGVTIRGQGVTRDLNESGCGFVAFERLKDKSKLELTISAADRTVSCRGVIRSQIPAAPHHTSGKLVPQAVFYGVQFDNPTKDQLETLWWMGAQFAVGLQYERFAGRWLRTDSESPLPKRSDEWRFELPVSLVLDEVRTVAGVTDRLGSETMTVVMPEAPVTDSTIWVDLATPFGRVATSAESIDSRSRKVAGRYLQEARFRLCETSPESRAVLERTLGQRRLKKLAPIFYSVPQQRPPESLRSTGIVVTTTAIVASIVVACVLLFKLDDVALIRAEAGHLLTAGLRERLVEMTRHVHMETEADESRFSRLRAVMASMGRDEDVNRIDEAIANSNPKRIEGRLLKAASLQNLKREKEAEALYQHLLAQLDELDDNPRKWQTVLSAARNASNLGDYREAAKRYQQLERFGPLTDEARIEFAGVLVRAGQTQDAEQLLNQGSPTFDDLRLLASIYSSTGEFSQAVATYRRMLAMRPNARDALLGLADNLSWSHDYESAAKIYQQLLAQDGADANVRKRLAEVLLYEKHYQQSLHEFTALLDTSRQREDLWNGFLRAAAGSETLTKSEQSLLQWIYGQHSRRKDPAFLKALASALEKHGSLNDAVSLLETLVDRTPRDAELRLQLADALQALKRYDDADVQYRWLLANMETPTVLTSEPASSVAPQQ